MSILVALTYVSVEEWCECYRHALTQLRSTVTERSYAKITINTQAMEAALVVFRTYNSIVFEQSLSHCWVMIVGVASIDIY